jgi:hypothetical protein
LADAECALARAGVCASTVIGLGVRLLVAAGVARSTGDDVGERLSFTQRKESRVSVSAVDRCWHRDDFHGLRRKSLRGESDGCRDQMTAAMGVSP